MPLTGAPRPAHEPRDPFSGQPGERIIRTVAGLKGCHNPGGRNIHFTFLQRGLRGPRLKVWEKIHVTHALQPLNAFEEKLFRLRRPWTCARSPLQRLWVSERSRSGVRRLGRASSGGCYVARNGGLSSGTARVASLTTPTRRV